MIFSLPTAVTMMVMIVISVVKFIALCPNFCIFCVKKSITVVTTAVRMEQVVWMVLSRTLAFALMAGKGLIAHKVSIYPEYFF